MSAQIRSEVRREVFSNFQTLSVTFYVYNPHSYFAGRATDRCAWEMLGMAAIYTPAVGHDHSPVIASSNPIPGLPAFPQVHLNNLRQATSFYEAMAEAFLQSAAIEAERAEWAERLQADYNLMAEAEAAEQRAHATLSEAPF